MEPPNSEIELLNKLVPFATLAVTVVLGTWTMYQGTKTVAAKAKLINLLLAGGTALMVLSSAILIVFVGARALGLLALTAGVIGMMIQFLRNPAPVSRLELLQMMVAVSLGGVAYVFCIFAPLIDKIVLVLQKAFPPK